jgi:predicted kinase
MAGVARRPRPHYGSGLAPEGAAVPDPLTGILISGTSHTGKSTLAAALGEALGWPVLATDRIARHPGRPWPEVRPHVAEYFTRLTPEAIYQFLLDHHRNMWPGLRRTIAEELAAGRPFVFEGSALRPDYLATLADPQLAAVCLHADPEFLRTRIRAASDYDALAPPQRTLVDAFTDRSLTDNARLIAEARAAGQPCVDAADPAALAAFRDEVIRRAGGSV